MSGYIEQNVTHCSSAMGISTWRNCKYLSCTGDQILTRVFHWNQRLLIWAAPSQGCSGNCEL